MRKINGSCHCGNIRYVLTWPLPDDPPLRRCVCGFCTRHGAVYTAHPEASLQITIANPDAIARYQFASKSAAFIFCKTCGVMPLVTANIEGRDYAVVNVNTFDEPPTKVDVTPRKFDGESLDNKVERRRRTWIGNVSIT